MRPKMEEALAHFALISVVLQFSTPTDFTVEEVINRVRQACILDDDEVNRDKAKKTIFSVENFREALAEEFAGAGAEDVDKAARSCGGFEDKTVEEVVKLVRSSNGPINWALFAPSATYKKSHRSSIRRPSMGTPGQRSRAST